MLNHELSDACQNPIPALNARDNPPGQRAG
jgi:hypothetical protein